MVTGNGVSLKAGGGEKKSTSFASCFEVAGTVSASRTCAGVEEVCFVVSTLERERDATPLALTLVRLGPVSRGRRLAAAGTDSSDGEDKALLEADVITFSIEGRLRDIGIEVIGGLLPTAPCFLSAL